jgi:transcription initiation factor IIE alpha subunit
MAVEQSTHEMGPGGYCICPKCETRLPHQEGVRCQDARCPQCGAKLLREGSRHWALWQEKKQRKSAE